MLRYLISALVITLLPLVSLADEVWTTPEGDIIYEDDVDGMAVLSYPLLDVRAMIYFPGLAGNYSARSTHEGFWIANEPGPCPVVMESPDGVRSRSWGRAVIRFDVPEFPSDVTMWLGSCFNDPDIPIRGESTAR